MSDIVPAKDLDHYLSDSFNQGIYQDLEELGLEPLTFFSFFYRLVAFIDEGQPSNVIKELDALNIEGGARLYILYLLGELKHSKLGGIFGAPTPEPSMFVIDKEYERVKQLFPPELFPFENASVSDRFCYAVGSHQFVVEAINKMIKEMIEKKEYERGIEARARQDERERLEQMQSKMVFEVLKAVKQPRQNPEFTTNKQVIALGFMLQRLGVKNIDKTVQSDFIEFLTGRNKKEIYDRVRELDQTVYNRAGKDAEYVQEWFRKLGLDDLVKEISDLLSKKSEDL